MSEPSLHPSPPRSKPRSTLGWRYRWAVVSRVTAALIGGYFFTHGATAVLTVVLPMSRINRVVTANLLSFVIWTAVTICVFAARNAWRSWWPLLAGGAVMLALALGFRDVGMRP